MSMMQNNGDYDPRQKSTTNTSSSVFEKKDVIAALIALAVMLGPLTIYLLGWGR